MEELLYRTLGDTLSGDEVTRKTAEDVLQQLLANPDGGISLTRLTFAPQADLAIRQLAGIMLQKHVKQYWSQIFPNFVGPMLPEESKQEIRTMLLNGLSEPVRKIRVAAAFALSSISQSDYPDQFPTLLPSLVHLLQSHETNPDGTHGAMRVLSELIRHDLEEDQFISLMQGMMPVLLKVLRSPQPGMSSTKQQTVMVFRQCIQTLFMLKDEYPEGTDVAMREIVPSWLVAFEEILRTDVALDVKEESTWEGLAVRNEVFRTLITLQSSFPRVLTGSLALYIELSLAHLSILQPTFQTYYLSSADVAPDPPVDPASGEDTQEIGVTELACSIVDLLTGISRARGARKSFVGLAQGQGKGKGKEVEANGPSDVLSALVYLLLVYTQITREDAEKWFTEPNAFIADDDEEMDNYSLRMACFDLLGSLLDKYEAATAQALQDAMKRRMQEAEQARSFGNEDWWRILEATLAGVGAVADGLLDMNDEQDMNDEVDLRAIVDGFELQGLFQNVIPQLARMQEHPFLQGRAFVFASQFVLVLQQAKMSGQYLEASIQALEAETEVPVKLSAIKTIRNFCRYIPPEELSPHSLRILSRLAAFLGEAIEETLALILETIRAVIGVDGSVLTGQATVQLMEVVIRVWKANVEDPVLGSIVEELLETIAGSPSDEMFAALVSHTLPALCECLVSPPSLEQNLALPNSAFELIIAILRGRKGSLGPAFSAALLPAAFDCLSTSADADAVQHGCDCLTLHIRKDCEGLLSWQAADGQSGLQKILGLLAKLLDQSTSESAGMYMGDLILHLLRNAGDHLSLVLPDLLRALVHRIVAAKTTIFTQTLTLPFAYLLTVARDQTLDLLEGMQVNMPNGESASGLSIVMTAWCDDSVDTVQGSYSIRVNNMAMCNLFSLERPALQQILVKGDRILSEAERTTIMTRSRTRSSPNQFQPVPFPMRALKYILAEIQNAENRALEDRENPTSAALGLDEDDGDDEWADDDPLSTSDSKGDMAFLSDLMGGGFAGWKDDEEAGGQDSDEDLMNDPLVKMNMKQHMVNVVREAYARNTNNIHQMIDSLQDTEKAILKAALTL